MPNPTNDPVTGQPVAPDDDYDYVADHLRNDPRRHLPKDVESVHARQVEAKAAGRPYYPTPWECQEMGKWWNVPEDEQAELMEAETPRHAWQEMIEPRLGERGLYRGRQGESPTPWDGRLGENAQWGNIVTTTRIGVLWIRLQPGELGRGSNATKTISAIMRKMGWTLKKQRVNGMTSSPYVWIPENPDRTGHEISAESVQNFSRTDDDDIPF